MDTVLDRYSDLAIGLAVTFAASQLHDSVWVWPAGFAATASFLMASYVTKEFQIRFHRPYPDNLVNKLKRRDLRILVIAVGAVVGQPLVALLAIGSLTHLAVFQILVSGWDATARPSRVQTLKTVSLDVNVAAATGQWNSAAAVVSPASGFITAQAGEPAPIEAMRASGGKR